MSAAPDKSQSHQLAGYFTARDEMRAGGGKKRVAVQREKGKMTARERVAALCDPHSFIEQQPYMQSRATEFGLGKAALLWRRGHYRLRADRWSAGLFERSGFHYFRRFAG